jgi:hypothetical protein
VVSSFGIQEVQSKVSKNSGKSLSSDYEMGSLLKLLDMATWLIIKTALRMDETLCSASSAENLRWVMRQGESV